ncbi:hypothetical protein [Polyangium sp. 15x6]|uniref:hypothetical protein n=1 Tax=Polyangium sp. 15x6 TaxID=3042687 RepID=UPI00249AD7B0|nr:hypothetical protein [Polyangium sp. 15x6]
MGFLKVFEGASGVAAREFLPPLDQQLPGGIAIGLRRLREDRGGGEEPGGEE